uniref:4Fe-4S ferredoxin n=1 Tax=candidate division WOR-3 bacterium TaxID=2052148 RepID=A0A7C4CDU8_UNCW3
MKPRIINRDRFEAWVAELVEKAELIAPTDQQGWSGFAPVGSTSGIDLTRLNTKVPAKVLFFPQCETILRAGSDKAELPVPTDSGKDRILLGIRSCDTAALEVLDRVFLDRDYPDPYYRERRERTALIGLACNSPADTCFCVALGGSPFASRGLDLLLVDLGDRYLAEPVTARGAALVGSYPEAADPDISQRRELEDKARSAIRLRLDPARLKSLLDSGFEHPVWEELSLPCINCGACTFLCPSCHCFDISDEERGGVKARIRLWDSCQFCVYSQHASGHNPRSAPRARLRNRIMDKFKYTVDDYGLVSCVGCGRCAIECPAAIDIRETVETLLARLPEAE